MKLQRALTWGMSAASAGILAMCLGCTAGKAPTGSEEPEAAHLGKLGEWSGEFAKAKKRSPKSLDELKSWAQKTKNATDEDFVSTRDHKPYVYKRRGGQGPAVIFETDGDGHRVYCVDQGAKTALATSPQGLAMQLGGGGGNDTHRTEQREQGGTGGHGRGAPGGGPGGSGGGPH